MDPNATVPHYLDLYRIDHSTYVGRTEVKSILEIEGVRPYVLEGEEPVHPSQEILEVPVKTLTIEERLWLTNNGTFLQDKLILRTRTACRPRTRAALTWRSLASQRFALP